MYEISISISSWLLGKIGDKGFDRVYDKLASDDLNKKFYQVVDKVSKQIQNEYPEILGDSINYFFKREKVFNELIKLLFKKSKVDVNIISEHFDTSTLPAEFIYEYIERFKLELLKQQEFDKILADNELYISILGIGEDVEKIANTTELTTSEIIRIRKILEDRFSEEFDIGKFKKIYKKNVLNNLSQLDYLGLGIGPQIKKNRKKLDNVFVLPNFQVNAELLKNKGIKINYDYNSPFDINEVVAIEYSDLFNIGKNIVILGDPGAGKSTLIKYIICSILEEKASHFHNKTISRYLPIRIELRKYLTFKKEQKGGLIKYLVFLLENEYSIPKYSLL